ncbi:hypothetical protein BDA96_04G098100 [Sorghum bicolor]|uniref:Embryo surrounding factor 1 brassicaceae domain-containing protein n=2 Tax=Sorghum bicolor TaxID=4558 RepID=A0A921UHK1_SORBI|nr:hypothetical protein BDA96_04G098100 [Sorghum bicolor]KXG29791.1 hypothetical protein SORBI_3004G090500 [Sorghum bicolor]
MDDKVMVVLLAVFLASCFLSPAMCQGDVAERSTGGDHGRLPPDSQEITEGSKFRFRLCLKTFCGAHFKTCYCCLVLPSAPCYYTQQPCWDICPGAAQPLQRLAAAPKALSPADFN